jgi:hypothetical protein
MLPPSNASEISNRWQIDYALRLRLLSVFLSAVVSLSPCDCIVPTVHMCCSSTIHRRDSALCVAAESSMSCDENKSVSSPARQAPLGSDAPMSSTCLTSSLTVHYTFHLLTGVRDQCTGGTTSAPRCESTNQQHLIKAPLISVL